ncbi:MAG: cation-translocating P-type ATPase [Trueperaceae bacterium]
MDPTPPTSGPSPAAERLHADLVRERAAVRRDLVLTGATAIGTVAGVAAAVGGAPGLATWGYAVAYLAGGVPTALQAVRSLRRGRLDIDLLMILAALAAAAVGEARDGAILLLLFRAAETAEAYAMGTTRRAVAGLMRLRPDTARWIDAPDADASAANGDEAAPDDEGAPSRLVPVERVPVGATVRVLPGERIPLDGVVTVGTSAVDASSLTGESVPLDRGPGDPVFAGSVNGHAALDVRTTAPASASTLARMVELVTEAQAARAPSQRISEWFGRRYTPWVLIGAAATLVGFGLGGEPWSDALYRTATLLVVASPCAVVISVPAAVLSALAAASRRGVLFKGGAALETFGRIDAFLFDKTGTLTDGRMRQDEVRPREGDDAPTETEVLRLAAALESRSEHPLAAAILAGARERGLDLLEPSDVAALPGHGLSGTVERRALWIGTRRLAEDRGALQGDRGGVLTQQDAIEADGRTAVLLGEDLGSGRARLLGVLGVADTVRPKVRDALATLARQGVTRTAMLTGDRPVVAHAIAEQVGIPRDRVHAGLLPEDKVREVRRYAASGTVAYLGDGINDAAALATAHVGVAMGAAGSDVALDTADVALLADDLSRLPDAHRLARRARRVLRQNLTFALSVMAGMVAWTLLGDVPLPLAVVAHEGGTLLVVANGLRLLIPQHADGAEGDGQSLPR